MSDTNLRPLPDNPGKPVTKPGDLGPAPIVQWVPLEDLVIDDVYQRPLHEKNWRQIRRIAENFDWRMFAAVVVAPVAGGKFAIIDGQHRSTAAKLVDLKEVPCQIVVADQRQQAAAFNAINAEQTKVSSLHRFWARVAAGEEQANAIRSTCADLSVRILRSVRQRSKMGSQDTTSTSALERAYTVHGRNGLITILQCLTETSNRGPGSINSMYVNALIRAFVTVPHWLDQGEALFAVIDGVDLESAADNAYQMSKTQAVERAILSALLQAKEGKAA